MRPLRKHRLLVYGRIASSVVLYVAFIVLDVTAAITGQLSSNAWMIPMFACLGLSVLLLPRRPVPRGEAREAAGQDRLEYYARIRKWLIWVRIAYLIGAIALVLGLPRVV